MSNEDNKVTNVVSHEFKVIEQKLDHITRSVDKITTKLEQMDTKITQIDKDQYLHDSKIKDLEKEMKHSNSKQIVRNDTLEKRVDQIESVVDNGHGMIKLLSLISLGISIVIGIITIGGFL